MNIKIVESSLNLRKERGYNRYDYVLSKEVAEKQLEFMADIYCNVEYMECNDELYLKAFSGRGYKCFTSIDNDHRGILCIVKEEYEVQEIHQMTEPHMLHLRVKKGEAYVDLITLRILVAGSNDADFIDRNCQWKRVLDYIEKLEDKNYLVLTGDWNHGVISEKYREDQARRFYNYHMILEDLREKNIELFPINGTSYRGYMKIDHVATGKDILMHSASYKEIFKAPFVIGKPDHNFIVAELQCT